MEIELIISAAGTVIGIAGLGYAIFTNREKAKLERALQINLSVIAGNILKIRESAHWSWEKFQGVSAHAINLPDSLEKKEILENAGNGMADSGSVERMLGNLLAVVQGTQESQFGTIEVRHPDGDKKATLHTVFNPQP